MGSGKEMTLPSHQYVETQFKAPRSTPLSLENVTEFEFLLPIQRLEVLSRNGIITDHNPNLKQEDLKQR